MKVLVTGASGTVGGAVVRALIARGHKVLAMVSHPAKAATVPPAAEVVVADLLDPQTASRLVPAADAVVHAAQIGSGEGPSSARKEAAVAAADQRMTLILAEACLSSPLRPALIYTSGVWVYGEHGDAWVDEDRPARPTVASRGHWATTQRLFELHRREGLRVTVLLPGLVYGAVRSFHNWFHQPLMRGELRMVGDGANHWSFIHADDLGAAYVHALEHPHPGQQFNIVDDQPVRLHGFMRSLAALARKPAPESISMDDARAALGEPLAESMALSVRASNRKARRLLEWSPRFTSIAAGLPHVLAQLAPPPPKHAAHTKVHTP